MLSTTILLGLLNTFASASLKEATWAVFSIIIFFLDAPSGSVKTFLI